MANLQFQSPGNMDCHHYNSTGELRTSRQRKTSDDVTKALIQFSLDVSLSISHQSHNENVIFSPMSTNNALKLVAFGALAETKHQIENALGGIALGVHFSKHSAARKHSLKIRSFAEKVSYL